MPANEAFTTANTNLQSLYDSQIKPLVDTATTATATLNSNLATYGTDKTTLSNLSNQLGTTLSGLSQISSGQLVSGMNIPEVALSAPSAQIGPNPSPIDATATVAGPPVDTTAASPIDATGMRISGSSPTGYVNANGTPINSDGSAYSGSTTSTAPSTTYAPVAVTNTTGSVTDVGGGASTPIVTGTPTITQNGVVMYEPNGKGTGWVPVPTTGTPSDSSGLSQNTDSTSGPALTDAQLAAGNALQSKLDSGEITQSQYDAQMASILNGTPVTPTDTTASDLVASIIASNTGTVGSSGTGTNTGNTGTSAVSTPTPGVTGTSGGTGGTGTGPGAVTDGTGTGSGTGTVVDNATPVPTPITAPVTAPVTTPDIPSPVSGTSTVQTPGTAQSGTSAANPTDVVTAASTATPTDTTTPVTVPVTTPITTPAVVPPTDSTVPAIVPVTTPVTTPATVPSAGNPVEDQGAAADQEEHRRPQRQGAAAFGKNQSVNQYGDGKEQRRLLGQKA